MIITTFNSKPTTGKTPISPYSDNSFDFKNLETDSLFDMFSVMAKNFILNLPLTENVRSKRRKTDLLKYYPSKYEYIVLDIDHINSKTDQLEILKYFKDYKCILGESRSTNNIDNFNLKGFLIVEPINLDDLRLCVQQIHDDLEKFGSIDTSVTRQPSLNAPMNKLTILLESNGEPFKFVYRPSYKSKDLLEIIKSPDSFTINTENLDLSDVSTIDQVCLRAFMSMGFEAMKSNGNCIVFKHPSETKTPGGYFWFKDSPYVMRHFNESKSVNIFAQIMKLPEVKNILQKDIDYNDKLLNFNVNTNVITVNERFLTLSPEVENAIQTFLTQNDGLFAIRSPMGTAKSVIIENIIQQALEQDFRVLVCANRISVAEDFREKFNLKLYNKDKYKLNDSFIVQYDSLWHYNIKNFDLVILDEFVSLLLHSRNNLNDTCQNLAKFFASFNKKLVISDAFLTGYENFLLQNKKDNLWLIDNQYRDDTKLFEYSDYNFFIQKILKVCRKHKATVSCTSLGVLYGLKLILEKYNVRVVTLTAETPQVTKHLVYECFKDSENDKFDVLLYSPTLTVGVSNLNNIDYHFHYDSSSSCDVVSSIQMIKRTRKAKEIHFYIKNRLKYLKTTYREIKDDYIANLGNTIDYNYLFEMNDYGEPRLSKIGKKAIQIDLLSNILESNHKNAFLFLLQYQFKEPPKIIEDTFSTNVLVPYIKDYKNSEKQFRQMCLNEYFLVSDFKNFDFNTEKSNIFESLEQMETRLELSKNQVDIKKEILSLNLEDSMFIEKCFRYNIVEKFLNDCLKESDIRFIIGSKINDLDETRFWNCVLSIKGHNLKEEYYPKELSDFKLKTVIQGIGYTKQCINGINKFKLDYNIEKYKKFIKTIGSENGSD